MDQYQIGLDHEVAQYYPKFNNGNKKNITLKHLLTHSSGLPGYVEFFKDDNIIASTCPLAGLHLHDINEQKNLRRSR